MMVPPEVEVSHRSHTVTLWNVSLFWNFYKT